MADATQRADEWIEESPALEILNDIAARLGTLFAIRGGVVRNLLARAVASDEEVRCGLFDLVDPLSDIDIVAPTVEVLESVLLQIHARLPLAGFHAWEAKTWMQVERFEATAPHTPLDRAQIAIDGRKPHLAQHEAAVKALESGSLWLQRDVREIDPIDRTMFALRTRRFLSQFALQPVDGLQRFLDLGPMAVRTRDELTRIETAALDIVLTANEEVARKWWPGRGLAQSESRLLAQLEEFPQGPVRVVAFPRRGNVPVRVQFAAGLTANAFLAENEPTLLPWTPVRLPRFRASDCCPYEDFSLGPLTIAWRGVDLDEPRTGVVALAPPGDPYDESHRRVIAVPGIISRGRSVVQRLDWGFIRYLAGDGRTVYIGARAAMRPEEPSS